MLSCLTPAARASPRRVGGGSRRARPASRRGDAVASGTSVRACAALPPRSPCAGGRGRGRGVSPPLACLASRSPAPVPRRSRRRAARARSRVGLGLRCVGRLPQGVDPRGSGPGAVGRREEKRGGRLSSRPGAECRVTVPGEWGPGRARERGMEDSIPARGRSFRRSRPAGVPGLAGAALCCLWRWDPRVVFPVARPRPRPLLGGPPRRVPCSFSPWVPVSPSARPSSSASAPGPSSRATPAVLFARPSPETLGLLPHVGVASRPASPGRRRPRARSLLGGSVSRRVCGWGGAPGAVPGAPCVVEEEGGRHPVFRAPLPGPLLFAGPWPRRRCRRWRPGPARLMAFRREASRRPRCRGTAPVLGRPLGGETPRAPRRTDSLLRCSFSSRRASLAPLPWSPASSPLRLPPPRPGAPRTVRPSGGGAALSRLPRRLLAPVGPGATAPPWLCASRSAGPAAGAAVRAVASRVGGGPGSLPGGRPS